MKTTKKKGPQWIWILGVALLGFTMTTTAAMAMDVNVDAGNAVVQDLPTGDQKLLMATDGNSLEPALIMGYDDQEPVDYPTNGVIDCNYPTNATGVISGGGNYPTDGYIMQAGAPPVLNDTPPDGFLIEIKETSNEVTPLGAWPTGDEPQPSIVKHDDEDHLTPMLSGNEVFEFLR